MQTAYVQENGSRVEVEDTFGYFRDALRCFNAGAYRASIGEIYNAVFMDVYTKLSNFTEVNGKEKYVGIFHRAQNSRNSKSPFEKTLAEELGKVGFLTEKQCEFLEELRIFRNDSSHPIGWDASQAQASYILTEAVTLFLGEPSLSPAMVQEEIVGRLAGTNFFGRDDQQARKRVVAEEMAKVIPAAYHLFVKGLVALWKGEDSVARRNAGIFLTEAIAHENMELQKAIIVQFVEGLLGNVDPAAERAIVAMVKRNPFWTVSLSETRIEKLGNILRSHLRGNKVHARDLLLNMEMRAAELLESALSPILEPGIAPHVTERGYLRMLRTNGKARDELLKQFCIQATGDDRAALIAFLNKNAATVAETLSGFESYRLLVATSERKILKRKPTSELGALLYDPAVAWFLDNPDRAWRDARAKFLPDPSLFLFTSPDDLPKKVSVG